MSARPLRAAPASRRTPRTLAVAAGSGLGLVLLAGPASAHVTVGADDNHQGTSDAVLTFRVPNEETAATTVKVTVTFPAKDPLASVKPAPKPGWTVTTKTVTFATPIKTDDGTLTTGVGEVTWTAASPSAGIPVGGYDAFSALVGPLPDQATELAFPTTQTYSNGKTVAWIEPTPPGGTEPEHPAPVLALAAASSGSVGGSAGPSASRTNSPSTTSDASPAAGSVSAASVSAASAEEFATKSDASTGRTLALVGLVLGALGLLAGAAAFARAGRSRG